MHHARELTRHLADLLRRERAALGDFLVALADFDRERRWRELGYTTLFDFLHRELGASRGSAYYRKTAAELIQRYPEVVEPLRDGRLCIMSVVELAKVITPENRAEVVPRFFHASKAEAKAIAAELRPIEAPPRRDLVTPLPAARTSTPGGSIARDVTPAGGPLRALEVARTTVGVPVQPVELTTAAVEPIEQPATAPAAARSRVEAPSTAPIDNIEPLTADLRRLHVTVSKRFLAKLEAARDALSHTHRAEDTEAVLEAALDLLLDEHARKKGLVKHPRAGPPRPSERPRHVPAAVKRAVWTRDGGRCQFRLASGEVCGSRRRLELDHVVPVARGGPSTIENLRVTCAAPEVSPRSLRKS